MPLLDKNSITCSLLKVIMLDWSLFCKTDSHIASQTRGVATTIKKKSVSSRRNNRSTARVTLGQVLSIVTYGTRTHRGGSQR